MTSFGQFFALACQRFHRQCDCTWSCGYMRVDHGITGHHFDFILFLLLFFFFLSFKKILSPCAKWSAQSFAKRKTLFYTLIDSLRLVGETRPGVEKLKADDLIEPQRLYSG